MQLHVHEWGDPAAPTVVCVHGVSAHGRRYRRLAEERLAARLPRAGARPARPRAVGVGAALESRDPPGRSAPDLRGRRAGDVGRPQLRRPAGAGARRAPAGAAHVRGVARPRDPDPAARRLRLRPGGRQGPRLRVAGGGDRGATDQRLRDAARGTRGGGAGASRARRPTASCAGATPAARSRRCTASSAASRRPRPCSPACRRCSSTPSSSGSCARTSSRSTRRRSASGLELVAVPGGHVVYWDAFEPTADAVEKFLIRHSSVSHP